MIYLTNKRLMMVLLLMLIFIPMFSTYFWTDITNAYESNMDFLVIYANEDPALANKFVISELAPLYEEHRLKLMYVNLPNLLEVRLATVDDYRHEEIRHY